MHHSKLCTIVIDCSQVTFDAGVAFWSAALGHPARRPDDPADPYVPLDGAAGGLSVLLQRIGSPSRIHLDIETDDVEAETARLEVLGAACVAQIDHWWIMRDPADHLFCVVPPQSPDFPSGAMAWE